MPKSRRVPGKKIYDGATDLRNRRKTVYHGKNVRIDFELSRIGIRKIAMGHELKSAVRSVVIDRALPYAIQISPHGKTLDYVGSFHAKNGEVIIAGMRRVACRLWNTSDHSVEVEWINESLVLTRTLAHLTHDSRIAAAAAEAAAKARFDPAQHPRGAGGRFAKKTGEQPEYGGPKGRYIPRRQGGTAR